MEVRAKVALIGMEERAAIRTKDLVAEAIVNNGLQLSI